MSHNGQFHKQLERLTSSTVLHGSESLCRLLRYLAQHALDQPNAPLKEYQIATEVYGRPADFDPQTDSTIRVQAGRLRAKLSEYYAGEGTDDPVVVDLPRGTYHLAFHLRSTNGTKTSAIASIPAKKSLPRKWAIVLASLLALLIVVSVAMGVLLSTRKTRVSSLADPEEKAPIELQEFWRPFLQGPEEPWVIFSNAAFIGRPETGMRYFNPARDAGAQVWDHYTGVGEVLGMHSLDQVFAELHRQIRVKRGSLFSLDDAKNNDLIFIGSPSENLTLLDIPSMQEFVFRRVSDGPRKGDLAIVNVHPQPGEPKECLASPSPSPIVGDYFVVGLMPGLNPARSVLILAGTTTFGTQAAAEYVSRQESLKNLLARLSLTATGQPEPFEALVKVKVVRGVPVEPELIAVHKRAR
jgi:hypothetical protein